MRIMIKLTPNKSIYQYQKLELSLKNGSQLSTQQEANRTEKSVEKVLQPTICSLMKKNMRIKIKKTSKIKNTVFSQYLKNSSLMNFWSKIIKNSWNSCSGR